MSRIKEFDAWEIDENSSLEVNSRFKQPHFLYKSRSNGGNRAWEIDALESNSTSKINIEINGEIVQLPREFEAIAKSIEKSRSILDLEENWDDDGAEAYLPETWKKTGVFLIDFASLAWNHLAEVIDPPKIYEGPEGSLDILWDTERFNLLINIPKEGTLAEYSGDNGEGESMHGKLDCAKPKLGLITLLKN